MAKHQIGKVTAAKAVALARGNKANAGKGKGGVASAYLKATITILSAPADKVSLLRRVVAGFSPMIKASPDGSEISVQIEERRAPDLMREVNKFRTEGDFDVAFVKNGETVEVEASEGAPKGKIPPAVAARLAQARAAAAEKRGEAPDEDFGVPTPPPTTTRRPPSQVVGPEEDEEDEMDDDIPATVPGWQPEPKAPERGKATPKRVVPRGGFLPPRPEARPTVMVGKNTGWPFGESYRPIDDAKLEELARKNRNRKRNGRRDMGVEGGKLKIALGEQSDRQYLVEPDRASADVWIASRTYEDAPRAEIGRGPTAAAAILKIQDYERTAALRTVALLSEANTAITGAPAAPQAAALQAAARPNPKPAPAPTTAAPTANILKGQTASRPAPAPAPNFSMWTLAPGETSRWVMANAHNPQETVEENDLEVLLALVHARTSGKLVVGWDGGLPLAQPEGLDVDDEPEAEAEDEEVETNGSAHLAEGLRDLAQDLLGEADDR